MVRLAQVVEYRTGTPKVQGSLPYLTFWSCGFLYLIGLSVTSKPFQTRNSIDGGFNIKCLPVGYHMNIFLTFVTKSQPRN